MYMQNMWGKKKKHGSWIGTFCSTQAFWKLRSVSVSSLSCSNTTYYLSAVTLPCSHPAPLPQHICADDTHSAGVQHCV